MAAYREEYKKSYAISTAKLGRLENEVSYYVENCHREGSQITVTGWCMSAGDIKLELLDGSRQPISEKVEHYYRKDLLSVFPECDKEAKPGFLVQGTAAGGQSGPFYLEMRGAKNHSRTRLTKWDEGTKLQYVIEKAGDTVRYLERNGVSATAYKIKSKLMHKEGNTYENWRANIFRRREELQRQREDVFEAGPLFSLVVPLYKTKPQYLREMIDSVTAQTYGNWELCMALAASEEEDAALLSILQEYAGRDARIHYQVLPENGGIAERTTPRLQWLPEIILCRWIMTISCRKMRYTNLRRRSAGMTRLICFTPTRTRSAWTGRHFFEPHFKPDFDLDLLCSVNYICHLLAVRKDVAERAGSYQSAFDGAQDLDFILRCSEQAKKIYHVPKILYHWRCHMDSTASNPESKLYAFEAGRRAIEEHYRRLGIPARVENASFYGMYRTVYEWKEESLVSIIIPNKDHAEDLKLCLDSIFTKSDYRNFEVVIVENNSTEPETFAYYKELEAGRENVRVVYYEGGFNYSKINNFGAAACRGDYFLLLNNDTEMIDGGCIREMLGYCMREDVGIVGAKLLYADDTIQHAGVILGFGGTAGHAFIGKSRYDTGYFGRILCAQDYSAVTAACMMTKREAFEAVGGMTEELAVAFNDVDYCLKVRKHGWLVVYDPYAEMHHYESKSRGYEDSPEKVERFNGEVEILLSRWRDQIEQGDPYYNPNLTLDNSDFSLRR